MSETSGFLSHESTRLCPECLRIGPERECPGCTDAEGGCPTLPLSEAVAAIVTKLRDDHTDLQGMVARGAELLDRDSPTANALVAAIRTFTVDMPDDQPNGEAERQLAALSDALHGRNMRKAIEAFVQYTEASYKDTKALREAADAHFGGSFQKPAACKACGGDGYYKGPRLGDEPCRECNGHGAALPSQETP